MSIVVIVARRTIYEAFHVGSVKLSLHSQVSCSARPATRTLPDCNLANPSAFAITSSREFDSRNRLWFMKRDEPWASMECADCTDVFSAITFPILAVRCTFRSLRAAWRTSPSVDSMVFGWLAFEVTLPLYVHQRRGCGAIRAGTTLAMARTILGNQECHKLTP
jgi:hypothetical protein